MSIRTTQPRHLAAGALAALALAGVLAAASTTTSSAASTDDPFTHTPTDVECRETSVYLTLSVDTTKIATPTEEIAVVDVSSDTGYASSSPGPLSFPVSPAGSIYWEIPYTDIESAHLTWTLKTQLHGAYIDSGTVTFDFVGLCGTVPSTTPPTTAPEPTPTDPPASVESGSAGAAPDAVVVRAPAVATAVSARPGLTG